MSKIPPNFGPIDPLGASAPLESDIRAITYPDSKINTNVTPTTYPNLRQITFQPIPSLESPPQYSAITFPTPAITYPDLSIVSTSNLPVAVRPRVIRPPTPLANPQPSPLPYKRSRSADSPQSDSDRTTVSQYYSQEFLPTEKRNRLIIEFNSYQSALAESLSTLAETKLKAAETTSKKYRKKLNNEIKSKEKEQKKLTKKLHTAELEINRLAYQSKTYQVEAESAFRTSEIQKSNLDSQLQVTVSENKNLISALELKTRAVAQLETDLLRSTTENKLLQADITLLRNSNQSKTNQEQTLQAELQQLHQQLTRKNSELQDTSNTVITLKAQITDLQKETHQLEKSHKEILQQFQNIQSELAVSKNELKLKNSEHATLEKVHKNLIQQLQSTISELGNTKLQLIDTNKELKDIQHSQKELLQLLNSTKSELDNSNSFSETLKLKNSTLNEQLTLLKQQSERIQQQLTGDKQTTSTAYTFNLEQDLIALKESNTILQISVTNYQNHSNFKDKQIEELESQVKKLSKVEQALQTEQNETKTLSQQITTLNTALIEVQQDHLRLQHIIQGYQDQLDAELPSISPTEPHNLSDHQSPSPIPNVLFNEQSASIDTDDMATSALDDLITALNRREDLQAIPLFSGTATDQYISSWLSEADAIATIHKWSVDIKKTNLASRLRGPALKWHTQRLIDQPDETYAAWKQALKDHFKHPADRDKQIIKLENLQQTPNVPIRNFIDKINALYNSIYNDGRNPQNADPELDSLKNDKLVQILLKGAIKPIRELIFQRLPSSNVTWKQAQEAAIMAESMMFKQLALDPQTPSTSSQQNPNVDLLTATIMQQQQKKLEELERKINSINFLGDHSGLPESTINYMGNDSRGRPSQRHHDNYSSNSVKWKDQNQKSSYNSNSNHHNRQRSNSGNYRSSSDNRNQQFSDQRNRDRSKSPFQRPSTPKTNPNRPPRDKSQVRCYRCAILGHFSSECRTMEPRKFRRPEK